MDALERYLNEATRGLWGKKREAARLELRGAIEEKLHRARLAGLSEAQALERALNDLGSARAVRGGFFRLHSAPLLGQLGALLIVSSAAVFALWPSSAAQVVATQAQTPITCVQQGTIQAIQQASPDMRRLYAMWLQRPDGSFDLQRGVSACQTSVSLYTYLNLSQLMTVWNAAGISTIKEANRYKASFGEPGRYYYLKPDFKKDGEDYINLYMIACALYSSGQPIVVLGDPNPTIRVGARSFKIGSNATPVRADDVYTALVQAGQYYKTIFSELSSGSVPDQKVIPFGGATEQAARALNFATLELSVREGAVVLFVYQGDPKTPLIQVARVRDGKIQVFLTAPYIQKWPMAKSFDKLKTGKLERPQWLLLDLSRTTDWRKPQYSIMMPSSIRLAP